MMATACTQTITLLYNYSLSIIIIFLYWTFKTPLSSSITTSEYLICDRYEVLHIDYSLYNICPVLWWQSRLSHCRLSCIKNSIYSMFSNTILLVGIEYNKFQNLFHFWFCIPPKFYYTILFLCLITFFSVHSLFVFLLLHGKL